MAGGRRRLLPPRVSVFEQANALSFYLLEESSAFLSRINGSVIVTPCPPATTGVHAVVEWGWRVGDCADPPMVDSEQASSLTSLLASLVKSLDGPFLFQIIISIEQIL